MRSEAPIRRAAVLLSLMAVFSLFTSGRAESLGNKPSDLDYSTTRLTEKGVFRVTYLPLTDPVPLNKVHSWRLHIEEADGQGLDEAQIMVDGGMPQHGHGLPTNPQVTQSLGGGNYLVEGMKFQMHGSWVVRFTITSGGTTDRVTFNLRL